MSESLMNLFQAEPQSPSHSRSQVAKGTEIGCFLQPYHSPSVAQSLIATAQALVGPRGRGIYATDESPWMIHDTLGITNASEEEKREKRLKWRQTAYQSLSSEYVSGVILYPETLLEFNLGPILTQKGIIPGVRANGELAALPRSPHEYYVEGLDNLLPALRAGHAAGAKFSKWRVPVACTSDSLGLPTQAALETLSETLAIFAATSQKAGLVPIVEPDVEFSGDASLVKSVEVHEKLTRMIFSKCLEHGVLLEGTLIKPSFPQPGLKHPDRDSVSPKDIALATAAVISNSVPSSVAGVVFLSGGLSSEVATSYLAALNALVNQSPEGSPFRRLPPLSFSFGRALQGDAVKHWVNGDDKAVKNAFEVMTKACWKATKGETPDLASLAP